jgi:hypothetical protein
VEGVGVHLALRWCNLPENFVETELTKKLREWLNEV